MVSRDCVWCSSGRSKQLPWAQPSNPGCTHANVTVEAGKTYRLRLISAVTLVYLTVCFEGHNVTLIAADASPIDPISFGSCVDINSGQRWSFAPFTNPHAFAKHASAALSWHRQRIRIMKSTVLVMV